MRVLHVMSCAAAGGAEIYVRDLAICMSNQGHDVFILFIDKAEEAGRDQAFEDNFLHQLDQHDIRYAFIGQSSRRLPWRGALALLRCCRKFSPDLIHTHLYFALIFAFIVPDVSLVYTHHNIRLGVNRQLYKIFDFRVSRYIGICHACKELLNSVSRRPVVRIDNGVESSRLLPRENLETHVRSPVLVSVGRLSQQKNLSLLIDALALVGDLKFTLKIAGEGSQRVMLEEKVAFLGLSSRVEFLGNVQNVSALLNVADIFVMSSEWEGLPISQIEATLSGLPVIVTNVGGCAEIVHRAANGLVVDERTPDEMARQLGILLTDDALRSRFSKNALLYSKEYRIEVAAAKHLELYQEIIDGRH